MFVMQLKQSEHLKGLQPNKQIRLLKWKDARKEEVWWTFELKVRRKVGIWKEEKMKYEKC